MDTLDTLNEDMMFMTEDQVSSLASQQEQAAVETKKFLIFISDELKIGVAAEYVVEIITNHSITHLPMLPSYVRGIINLRGQIVPILDIRLRLGKEPKDDCLVIVLNIENTQIGILVDAVDQMVDIPKEDILPLPAQSNQKLVSGMCSLPDGSGTMLVLEGAQVIHE